MPVIYRKGVKYGGRPSWDDINNKPDLVEAEEGKGLSTNDFTDENKQKLESMNAFTMEEKNKLAGIDTGAQKNPETYDASKITGVIDISHLPSMSAESVSWSNVEDKPELYTKSEVNALLATKIDAVAGKDLSTNDYSDADKAEVAKIKDKASTTVVNDALDRKVDKIYGKSLSTNDYTTTEKTKLAGIEAGAQKNPTTYAASLIDGVIDISHLPSTVIERMSTVVDDTARFTLTTDTVQNGDSVKVISTGKVYMVVDDTKLDSEDGYSEYAVGRSGAVPWSGVEDKPSTIAGYGIADAYTKTEVDDALELKADKTTTYTKTEVDALIATLVERIEYLESLHEEPSTYIDENGYLVTNTSVDNNGILDLKATLDEDGYLNI